MRPATALRAASGVAAGAAGVLVSVVATTQLRGAVVIVAAGALVSFAVSLLRPDDRVLLGALLLFGLATAVALTGPVRWWRLVCAALEGLLVLLVAELSRWAALAAGGVGGAPGGAAPAGDAPSARPRLEVRRGALLTGLAATAAAGVAGGALGVALVAGRGTLAGFGLAALALGVSAGVGLVLLLGTAGQRAG